MAIRRFEYTPTPTDERSVTDQSWKTISQVKIVEEKGEDGIDRKPTLIERWTQPSVLGLSDPVNWKPLSMTTPILSAIIITTLLMIVGIELLAQKSAQQGGLALSPSLDEIPQWARISSEYVPQVLAVAYSLVWSWVDLDVKRMQPWFEMSKPEGALARDSLLLDYPFTFVAFVPFVAIQRKHWMVFLSGTAMVLIFWAITPLQSAQLGTGAVKLTEPRGLATRSRLLPVDEQTDMLDSKILHAGYAIAWLEQQYPPFTTPTEAFLPFYATENAPTQPGANWTAETTRLTTELDCWPAELVLDPNFAADQDRTYNFLNGQGCNTTVTIPKAENISMFYMGYHNSPYSNFWLENKACPLDPNVEQQFLATWAHASPSLGNDSVWDYNVTALFCQSSYYQQQVQLTVDATTLKPHENSVSPTGPKEALADSDFNNTAFKFLLANGMPQEMKERDYPDTFVVDQHTKLKSRGLWTPVSNMVGYALSAEDRPSEEYSNPETLAQAYLSAHQSLFSVAASHMFTNHTRQDDDSADVTFTMYGIVVNRSISAALEALLLVIALFTAFILWLSRGAYSNLHANPSSISRVAEVLRDSPQMVDLLCSVDNGDEEALKIVLGESRFRLLWSDDSSTPFIQVREAELSSPKPSSAIAPKGYYSPVKPAALRLASGIAFIIAILAMMVGLGYLKWAELKYTGLSRPSSNREVQQILENYLPTILSTFIEPFWVLVNRLLCVLQPFDDLWRGRASPDSSIAARYTSIPPQFAIVPALRLKHLMLGFVCSAVFLSNILTISMPAVFQDQAVVARYPSSFRPAVSPSLNEDNLPGFGEYLRSFTVTASYHDHAVALLANMSIGTSHPPWVSDKYYFAPSDINPENSKSAADSYLLQTQGFTVNANCTPVASHTFPMLDRPQRERIPDEETCGDVVEWAQARARDTISFTTPGLSATEYTQLVGCNESFVFGWARTEHGDAFNGTIRGSFAVCRPYLETASFDVQVDRHGYVQRYDMIGDIGDNITYEGPDTDLYSLATLPGTLSQRGAQGWHNETFSKDWLNHLIMIRSGSRDIVDPHAPVPDPEEMIKLIDPIYRTLFALLLAFNRDYLFGGVAVSEKIEGFRLVTETRLFMDTGAFVTSVVLLGVNVAIALAVYVRKTPFILPHIPTTIGSIAAYIAPSRLLFDHSPTGNLKGRTFSFGRFIGHDGTTHVGIELDPFVVPIDPSSFGKPARSPWGWFGKRQLRKPFRREPWI
ncbi:uncharacterized protein F5Z01DRAFT_335474 [Emericellopsis atlantica]|uniref:Uncharacterized protein n=1 Tax=Emericellopsis atlantica TaxID=2614577 RepID=A0A9P8CL03_9HYPO|nr:uncharacterized protein F5Z01DRAFT_335474 [Emericellopsis atlantica]KAG9250888.1 hypothetical protein F5Z01DRAFT_335474 [Emericellopsis atlantica]